MNKILEIINKEKIVKRYRKGELVQKSESNEKCAYCKQKFTDSEGVYTYTAGNYNTGEKKSFSFCFCSIECREKFLNENNKSEIRETKDFSRTYLFAGNEFNQELERLVNNELKNQI